MKMGPGSKSAWERSWEAGFVVVRSTTIISHEARLVLGRGGVWAPRGKCLFVLKLRTRACLLYGVLGRPTSPTGDDPNAKPNDFFFDMERDATCFGMPACGRLQR